MQDVHETTAPLLAALAELESQEYQAWQAGIEAGETKGQLKHLAEVHGTVERQQRLTTDEAGMAGLEIRLGALRAEAKAMQVRLKALQNLRVEAENRAMHLREELRRLGA